MKVKSKIVLTFITLMCVILSTSCGKDDGRKLSIAKKEITLNSKQEGKIVVSPTEVGCIFTSENKYIANVSSTGKITPITVGTTYVLVSNSAKKFSTKCKITVTPTLFLFREPYLLFGASKATVRKNENRGLVSETSTSLVFNGENSNISLVLYSFDSQGKMVSAAVVFPTHKIYTTMDFLAERYVPLGYDDGFAIFMSNDSKMGVGITSYNSSYYMIIYSQSSSYYSMENTSTHQHMIDLADSHFKKL